MRSSSLLRVQFISTVASIAAVLSKDTGPLSCPRCIMLKDVLRVLCVKHETVNIDHHPTTVLCSLESLPEELYHFVLTRIFVHSEPSDLLSLLLVCKTWRDVGRHAPVELRPNKLLPLALVRGFPKVASLNLCSACEVQDERLPCLVGLENLVALNLERCREVTSSGLAHLHPLARLQFLTLGRCPLISDAGLVSLCQNLVDLKMLNIKHCYGLTSQGLVELTRLTALTSFNCSGCRGMRYEALVTIGRVPTLQVLKMTGCAAAFSRGIDPLFALTELKVLKLKTKDPLLLSNDVLLQGLAERLRQLERLDFTFDAALSTLGFEGLTALTHLRTVKIDGKGLIRNQVFSAVSNLPKLRDFDLVDEEAGDSPHVSLSALQSLRSLAIKKSGSSADDQAGRGFLVGLPHLTQLTRLILSNMGSFTGDAVGNLKDLQELLLKGCPLLESRNMAVFTNLRRLRVLKFHKCSQLDDAIVDVLKWIPSLERLYISECPRFTGRHLGVMSQLTELTTVVLQYSSSINDNAMKQLAAITTLRRLEVLMCNEVTDDGFRVLLNGDLKNLEYLNISGPHAPRWTAQLLQHKLPKFRKYHRGSVNLFMLK